MGRLLGNALAGHQGDMQGVALDPAAFNIPDAEKYRKQAGEQYDSAITRGQYIQPKQRSFLEGLEKQAAGQGPSLAAEQLKQAQNRSLAQQMAAAQASRGYNPALAQRNLMQGASQSNANMAAQATQARMQEQLNAQQMLGNQVNTMQSSADNLTQQYLDKGFSIAQAQQAAAVQFQQMSMQQALGLAGINGGIQSANHAQDVAAVNNQIDDIKQMATMGAGGMGGGSKSAKVPDVKNGGTQIENSSNTADQFSDKKMMVPRKAHGGFIESMRRDESGKPCMDEVGMVPGKAPKKGDNLANDIVHVRLSPGEIVVPRTAATDPEKAKSFIDGLFAARKRG